MIFTKKSRISIVSVILFSLTAMAANAKPMKDTPVPADGKSDYVNFYHNESKQAGKCTTDCDCDGMRSCDAGKCTGTASPAKLNAETCNTKEYKYQEAWTKAGPGKCSGDCECDGLRTCTNGECTGTAR